MSRLTRDGMAQPISRDQILRRSRGQRNVHFPCSAHHELDWQPYPVDPQSDMCDDHLITQDNQSVTTLLKEKKQRTETNPFEQKASSGELKSVVPRTKDSRERHNMRSYTTL